MSAPTAEQKRYWNRIIQLGCVAIVDGKAMACGSAAEIAHGHGGSIVERMQEPKAKGKKLARCHWIVLPLCPPHGREPYPDALDTNVELWELVYGPQAKYIDWLITITGVDVWALAKQPAMRRYRRPSKVLPRRFAASI